jgi:putative membrane fusion protein
MRFDGFDRSIEDLKMKTLSREYIYRDKSELETLIKDIKQQIKALDISTGSIKKRVYSPSSGYFASEADGFEGSIDSKKIMEITPGEFTALIEADTVKGSKNTGIGKIIKDYVWYFAAVTDASKADLFKNLKTVTLKSSNRFYPDVTAKIARISEADDGTTLVVFRIDEHVSEFSSVRKLSTQVVLNTYKGLKVPREALRVDSDGIQGVYCLMDSQARFKKVNVIFEKDSYYIVDYDTANKDSLLLYDQIIISSKDMEHGKVLK